MVRRFHQQLKTRKLFLEHLEHRHLLTSIFTNTSNPLDVNADTHVSPIDAVMVLNKLSRDGAGDLPVTGGARLTAFYDVNGNAQVEPNDLLRIVNFLNGGPMVGSVSITPPAFGVRGQPIPFSFATELLDQVEYGVDWDGNGSVDETVQGPGQGVTVEHAFPQAGEQRVRVTAQVRRTGAAFRATSGSQLVVDAVEMQGDNLVVGGTTSHDTIMFTSDGNGQVTAELNGLSLGTFSVDGSLVAYGQFGDDVIESSGVPSRAEFHAGGRRA